MAEFNKKFITNQELTRTPEAITREVDEFLQALDPGLDAVFNIEHYTDCPKGVCKPLPDPLAGQYQGLKRAEVLTLVPKLVDVNNRGAGIFVARNQFSGSRKVANLSRVRGVHADMDSASVEQIAELRAQLAPTIVVRSSDETKLHLYWQLQVDDALDAAEAKAINQLLARQFGADSAAVDVARLLRLPGFRHMKGRMNGYTPVVQAEFPGHLYSAHELRTAFPVAAQEAVQADQQPLVVAHHLPPKEDLMEIESRVASRWTELWCGDWQHAVTAAGVVGYPSQSEADLALAGHIARAAVGLGLSGEQLASAVEAVFSRSGLGASDKWQNRPTYRQGTIRKSLQGAPVGISRHEVALKLDSHGDVRTGRAFADLARFRFKYVKSEGTWLQWVQQRWSPCKKEEEVAFAKRVCQEMVAAASAEFARDQSKGKKLLQDAVAAHALPRIQAMLKLAVSEPDMAANAAELDADPYLLGVENGLVDLRHGHHLFNQPNLLVTKYCTAGFREGSPCPRWQEFLTEVFQGDQDTIDCVQRLLGYTLTGLVTEEVMVICYGHGSNGKSVFSNVIHRILGGYAVTAPPSLLVARRGDDTSPRNDVAALAGARLVSVNELRQGDRLDEQVVKLLAGREPISARFLHQEYFEYMPTFTVWLRTNHKPIITGEDDGIWRRLVLLKFGRQFIEGEKNPHLEQQLMDERDGILHWMIQGARQYLRDGLKLSAAMQAELHQYRRDSDLFGEFLNERATLDTASRVDQTHAYQSYRAWCGACGLRPISKKSFTQKMVERGFTEAKSGRTRYYVGLDVTGVPMLG